MTTIGLFLVFLAALNFGYDRGYKDGLRHGKRAP